LTSRNFGFLYISETAEASDFKFGARLGFAKDNHIITRRRKRDVALDWGVSQYMGFSFNIHIMAEASDFKFGTQLVFVKIHHKLTPRGKVRVVFG